MISESPLSLFPTITLCEWVILWEKCYSDRYGDDDIRYAKLIMGVQRATDDDSLYSALYDAFKWKDRIYSRWAKQISTLKFDMWCRLKQSNEIPEIFPNGIVYNVFLEHLASEGRRPIIDQHAWRAFCYVSRRGDNPEIAGANRNTGLKYYSEYEGWFRRQVDTGIDRRKLDKALMAFGQFFVSQFEPIARHIYATA